jgi:CheY-like chemotaxis protein
MAWPVSGSGLFPKRSGISPEGLCQSIRVLARELHFFASVAARVGTQCARKDTVDESSIAQSHGLPYRRHRLLVAEDNRSFRELLVAVLMADGHEVVAVTNGGDLLDTLAVSADPLLGSGKFDLVISDVRMPGSTGLQVLSQMAGAPRIPPFILITAFGGQDLHAAASGLGVLAVIDKPFDVDDLRRFVSEFLDTAGT